MERNTRVQIGAGLAMLVLCVLIGVVEGATVLRIGSWTYFAPWLTAFLIFLVSVVVATARATPPATRGRLLIVAAPVLSAGVIVLLSPAGVG